MWEPDQDKLILAMVEEISDLNQAKMWELEERDKIGSDEKIIKAIWSFKCKRLPDGTYLKHKAQLCAHGGMQIAGEHYWDTYSPVVQWMTLNLSSCWSEFPQHQLHVSFHSGTN